MSSTRQNFQCRDPRLAELWARLRPEPWAEEWHSTIDGLLAANLTEAEFVRLRLMFLKKLQYGTQPAEMYPLTRLMAPSTDIVMAAAVKLGDNIVIGVPVEALGCKYDGTVLALPDSAPSELAILCLYTSVSCAVAYFTMISLISPGKYTYDGTFLHLCSPRLAEHHTH